MFLVSVVLSCIRTSFSFQVVCVCVCVYVCVRACVRGVGWGVVWCGVCVCMHACMCVCVYKWWDTVDVLIYSESAQLITTAQLLH